MKSELPLLGLSWGAKGHDGQHVVGVSSSLTASSRAEK